MPPKRGRGRGRGFARQEQESHPSAAEASRPHVEPSSQYRPEPPGFRPHSRQEQEPRPPGFRPHSRQEQEPRPPGFRPHSRQEQEPRPYAEPPREPRKPPPGFGPPSGRKAPGFPRETSEEDVPRRESAGPSRKERPRPVHPEELGIQLEQRLHLEKYAPLPVRPNFGQMGRRIRLVVNCFPIDIPSGNVYHYDVEIERKKTGIEAAAAKASVPQPLGGEKKYRCLSTKRNREVINTLIDAYGTHFRGYFPVYDGRKNLYTRKPLKNAPYSLDVTMEDDSSQERRQDAPDRREVYHVSIKPVQKKETNSCAISLDPLHALFKGQTTTVPQEAIMALETVLRHGPCMKLTPIGRSFFYPPHSSEICSLGGGREVWFGYHQSLRLGQWRPVVNIDISATTFYQKGPVITYICNILGVNEESLSRTPTLRDADIVRLSKELKNLRIKTIHLKYPRKYRIVRLTRESAAKLQFTITKPDGKQVNITVAQYFSEEHRRRLQFPHLPCLQVGPEAKKVYLPIEVCELIEGQHCKKKLTEDQTREMIKFTARSPKDRFAEIDGIVRDAEFHRDEFLKEFGLRVSQQPMKIEGRVIEAPNVRYSENDRVKPREGSWDMRNRQFFRGAEVDSWVLISFANPRFCHQNSLSKFADMLQNIGSECGISIDRPAAIDMVDTRNYDMNSILKNVQRRYKATLAIVVLPAVPKNLYGEVKQAAETVLGLTTQCVKDKNVSKCNASLVSNLCQKINAKMGGVNNSLTPGETPEIFKKPVIIIGADVTHPAPTEQMKPSLAAAVGSLDAHPSRYAVTCRAQTHADENKQAIEIILEFKSMVIDLLKAFYNNTKGKKPEKIIVYRDGVSEGQFAHVRDFEIKQIRNACASLSPEYQPGITFIVVQKRHHTRFRPEDMRDGVGRMRNVPPGTTVDTDVCHPVNFDFFLCSHFGLQGTSRPSHYTVLDDDNDFTADDLQKLTYYLCHTYVRCTKSISVPSPVMYAHLAAYRARQHLITQMDESSASSDTSAAATFTLPQQVIDAIKVVDELKSTMYFV